MNRKLIKALKRERLKLYPYGLPIQPRGFGKSALYAAHILRYISYDVACDTYKNTNREVSIEEAHRYMNSFMSEIWQRTISGGEL